MGIDVPAILYAAIDEVGRDKIRMDLSSDIASSKRHCDQIIELCIARIGAAADEEILVALCEGLLHFLLTASLLPSQRKLKISGMDVDLVIPSSRMLLTEPDKALIIQVIRNKGDMSKASNAESIQPKSENVWLISARKLPSNHRSYAIDDSSFSMILVDISDFVSAKGIGGLKLFH